MKKQVYSAYSFLENSKTASKQAELDLGFDRSCAVWTNSDDHVIYDQLEGHTFSFYRRGGRGVYRVDDCAIEGWEGALCIFPHGQSSEWVLSKDPIEMVHLYVPDAELKRMFTEWTDRDCRLLQVADVTYASAGVLSVSFEQLFRALLDGENIHAESAMMDLVSAVLAQDHTSQKKMATLKGGLALKTQSNLVEFIEENLEETIRLQDLAAVAGLSEFHLQRSFRDSCGVTPNVWIAHRRVERAKAMIEKGSALSEVAIASGYSSQAHMTRSFKVGTGLTPSAYRARVSE